MANNHEISETHVLDVEDGKPSAETNQASSSFLSVPFLQKVIAEALGTYFMTFAGCGAVAVNFDPNKSYVTVSSLANAIVWGLVVMVMIYSVGHISGGHFNPAATVAFAAAKTFPWKLVPAYVVAQACGATLACGTLRLTLNDHQDHFLGTSPSGTVLQAFVIEFIISFHLMFVASGVATDSRGIGELAGLVVGSTVTLNILFAGRISGASMNPARSLGPAVISNRYKHLWIYLLSPTLGGVCGALVYNVIRFTDKPLRERTKSGSFLKGSERSSG